MKHLFGFLLIVIGLHAAQINAAGEIVPGTPVYRGSGCPKDSVSVTFAPDGLSFSVIYDQMVADLAAGDKRREKFKSCELWIPLTLPSHTAVSIDNIDYRGFAALPTEGKAALHAAYGFWPSEGHGCQHDGHFTRKFKAPFMDEYQISTGLFDAGHKQTSACGGKVYLRLSDWLHIKAKKGADAQIALDSVDGALTAQYGLSVKKCK